MAHPYSDNCPCGDCSKIWQKVLFANTYDFKLVCPCGGEMKNFGYVPDNHYVCNKCSGVAKFAHQFRWLGFLKEGVGIVKKL